MIFKELQEKATELKQAYDKAEGAVELSTLCDQMADLCDAILNTTSDKIYAEIDKQYKKEDITNRLVDDGYYKDEDEIPAELVERIYHTYQSALDDSCDWGYALSEAISRHM